MSENREDESPPVFSLVSSHTPIEGSNISLSDGSLMLATPQKRTGKWFVVFDYTLQLNFDAEGFLFSYLAFAPRDIWKGAHIDLPQTDLVAGLHLARELPPADVYAPGSESYLYDPHSHLMCIRLLDSEPEIYALLGQEIVAGLSGTDLAQLYLSNLLID